MLSEAEIKSVLSEFDVSPSSSECMIQECLMCGRVHHIKSHQWISLKSFIREHLKIDVTDIHCPPCGSKALREAGLED